jgi:hypothetical protein
MARLVDGPHSRTRLYAVRTLIPTDTGYTRGPLVGVYKAKDAVDAGCTAGRELGAQPPLAVVDLSAFLRNQGPVHKGFDVWLYEQEGDIAIRSHTFGTETGVYRCAHQDTIGGVEEIVDIAERKRSLLNRLRARVE